MEPIVDLAPGADSSILGPFFAERVRESLKNPRRRAVFFSLKATIFVVDFDSGQATTLRFDHGRLTLHEGTIGMPSVTFGGPLRALLALDRIRLSELPRALLGKREDAALVERTSSPPPASESSSSGPTSQRKKARASLSELLRLLARGEVKVYGYLQHPRTILRFLRLISSAPEVS